jgi:hypothetical protein
MSAPASAATLHGLIAEFSTPKALVDACEKAHHAGYRRMDAYSPFPIEAAWEAIGHHRSRVPLLVLLGALTGALAGYGLQYWVSVIVYPLNVGGRPYHSWPAFIPVTFETTVLLGGFCAVIGMLALNGLPRPHHPVFNVPEFVRASRDGYFLCIEAGDPKFDRKATFDFLKGLAPIGVHEVQD